MLIQAKQKPILIDRFLFYEIVSNFETGIIFK